MLPLCTQYIHSTMSILTYRSHAGSGLADNAMTCCRFNRDITCFSGDNGEVQAARISCQANL